MRGFLGGQSSRVSEKDSFRRATVGNVVREEGVAKYTLS